MTTIKRFLTLFLLITLSLTYAFGATSTLTLKSATSQTSPYEAADGTTWTFTNLTFVNSNNSCVGSSTGQIVITPPTGATVTSVTVKKTGNAWAGAAELKFYVGSSSTAHTTLTSSSSTTTEISLTGTDQTAGSYKLSNQTSKNCWVEYITITYTTGGTPTLYTVTLKDDNSTVTQGSAGAAIDLPSRTGCSGYTFAGWTSSWTSPQSSWTTTALTIITAGTGAYTPTSNIDLYPVYTKTEGGGGGVSVTYTASEQGYTNAAVPDSKTISGVTFAYDKGEGVNDPKYYTSGTSVRMYANNTLTITSSVGNMTAITFTFGGTTTAGLTASVGTYSAGSWSGDASSVTFTAGSTGQQHIQAIVIGDGGGTTSYISVPSCGPVINASDAYVTSANGQYVKVIIPVQATNYEDNATLTASIPGGTRFTILSGASQSITADVTLDGEVVVQYNPNASNTTNDVTLTLSTASPAVSKSITIHGRSLPEEFAIVANNSGDIAMPANMNGTPDSRRAQPVTITAGQVECVPAVCTYTLEGVATGRYADHGTAVRLKGYTTNKYLKTVGSDSYELQNTDYTDDDLFEWILTTSDNESYEIQSHNAATVTATRQIRHRNTGHFGNFNNTNGGVKILKFIEVAADCKPMNVTVTNITHNSAKIEFEGTASSHTLTITGAGYSGTYASASAYTSGTVITGLSASTSYTYTLTPSCSANCAVTGSFSTIAAPITVTLSKDGKTESLGEQANPYTLPTSVTAPCEGWTFDGWSKTSVTTGSTSYTKVTQADETHTYYAVYKTSGGGGGASYTKVANDAGLVSGKNYVIGYYAASVMHVAGAISDDYLADVTGNTSADGSEITALSASAEIFTLGGTSGAWTLTSTNGVLGATAVKKVAYDSGTQTWSISISSGDATITNTTGSCGTLYFNSGSPRFTTYTSTQKTPSLYLEGSGYEYSSTTDCKECTVAGASFSLGDVVNKSSESADFTNTVTYTKTNTKTQEWTSSNTSVATVNATTGLVHIVAQGTTTITLSQALDDTNDPDNVCAVKISYVLNVNPPAVDVVEVTADDKIIIEHDIDDSNSKIVVAEQETGVSGNVAKDIFFSKYYEAASNLKLFALYNGTKNNIDLSKLRVRASYISSNTPHWPTASGSHGYLELSSVAKLESDFPGYLLPPFTEIIFWSNNHGGDNAKLRACVAFEVKGKEYDMDDLEAGNVPGWYCVGSPTDYATADSDGNLSFVFNGPNTLLLERDSTSFGTEGWKPIDILGAVDASGNPINTRYANSNAKPAKAEGNGLIKTVTADGSVVNDTEKYTINGIENMPLNDDPGGFWAMADYDDADEIPLSTNRYYLYRKSDVEDGSDAVKLNIDRFNTLSTEWVGKPVGGAKSDATSCYSGEMFSEVGSYDYSHYFTTWNDVSLNDEDFQKLADGTYSVKIDNLAGHSCKTLRICVTNLAGTDTLAKVEYKVPIIVKNGTKNTNDAIFTGDGFGSEVCSTCDVVVLNGATLEASTALSAVKEVRNLEVYAGGTLNIDGSKELTVNQLIMRSKDDAVSRAKLPSENFSRRNKTILFDKRITGTRWYWLTLPYDWKIDDVTFRNGEPAKYNVDWWLRTYDGKQRATGDESKSTNWVRVPDHSTLKAGAGYIVAVNPTTGHTYGELRFPMAAALLDKDRDVTVPVKAWGATTSVAPNHLGWNLVGNPYLNDYEYSGMPDILTVGKLVFNSSTGLYELNTTAGLRYVVESVNPSGYGEYKQEALADNKLLEPFKAYFVQIDGSSDGQALNIEFAYSSSHMRKSPVRRAPKDYLDEAADDIVWVPINLTNVLDESDETTFLVSNRFTDNYDMMDDLAKWRRAYYEYYDQPILASRNKEGEMVFNALPDSSAMAGIPLNFFAPTAGTYTMSLNNKYGVENIKSAKLYDAVAKIEHDLKANGAYTFSTERTDNTSRFILYLAVERQKVPTGIGNANDDNAPRKILYNGTIYIVHGGKVYDITGKQLR